MKKLRVMALMDEELVPPDNIEGYTDEQALEWKTEYDVVTTLGELGHDVLKLGASDDLDVIRAALLSFKPHIT
ncbi:MAG: D-alanine--D-alanine ligase, partial [Pirellulaceae bacterium]|nr:D-alanine--D-alanine ligase [Pirellulaceae bacterium]